MEQANARHEHEWRVWEDVTLPEGKKLIPGVVTHHTNVVEHPELVAQRLVRLANVVGKENVLAGTDCGFAQGAFIQRVHPEIQWAKLAALAEGARLASQELWGPAQRAAASECRGGERHDYHGGGDHVTNAARRWWLGMAARGRHSGGGGGGCGTSKSSSSTHDQRAPAPAPSSTTAAPPHRLGRDSGSGGAGTRRRDELPEVTSTARPGRRTRRSRR